LIAVAIIGSAASLGRSVGGYYGATNEELTEHIAAGADQE
jgi:Flp pilus assembly pilin Flp